MTTPLSTRILLDELEAAVVDVGAVVARDAALSTREPAGAALGGLEPPD